MCTFYISKTKKFAIYGKKNSWKSKFCKNWPTLLRKKTGEFEVEKTWFLNSPSKKCIKVTGVMPKSMLPWNDVALHFKMGIQEPCHN